MSLKKRVSIRRRIFDGLIAFTSVAVLWAIIVTIDARAGDQLTRYLKTGISDSRGTAYQLQAGVSHASRSARELSFVYGPLMTFSGVAIVLVYLMIRTK